MVRCRVIEDVLFKNVKIGQIFFIRMWDQVNQKYVYRKLGKTAETMQIQNALFMHPKTLTKESIVTVVKEKDMFLPKLLPLNAPFGELWEREILRAAGADAFITYRFSDEQNQPPILVYRIGLTYKDGFETYSPNLKSFPNGRYVEVGKDWLRNGLSEEGLASYIAYLLAR